MIRWTLLALCILVAAISFGCTSADCENCNAGAVRPIEPVDTDQDGIGDMDDNCPEDVNPDQADADSDGQGDICDPCPDDPLNECSDRDEDGVLDQDDNCPDDANPDQADVDEDGVGDVCDPCPEDPLDECADADEDGVPDVEDNCPNDANVDQLDTDEDGAGDVCDPCPDDPLNECGTGGPTLIPAALLSVASGCDTYIGANPVVPDDPTEVLEYEFCADGSVTKSWDPSPGAPIPGPTVGTGTWFYDGNELTIDTTASILGSPSNTVETYDVAFTYDNGARLDLSSAAQTAPGDGSTVVGDYERHAGTVVTTSGSFAATIVSTADTTMTVTEGAWEATLVEDNECTGSALVCGTVPPGATILTSGTFTMPGELYDLDGTYIFQTEDTLVLERQ